MDAIDYVMILKKKGFSYDQIAEFSGVSKRTVFNWVNGKSSPYPSTNIVVRHRLQKNFREIMRKGKPSGKEIL